MMIGSYTQGDTKGPARGADGIPAKKDTTGAQMGSDAQVDFEITCSVIGSGAASIIDILEISLCILFNLCSHCG